ncbi:unnamed protein product [Laminaria digitata]
MCCRKNPHLHPKRSMMMRRLQRMFSLWQSQETDDSRARSRNTLRRPHVVVVGAATPEAPAVPSVVVRGHPGNIPGFPRRIWILRYNGCCCCRSSRTAVTLVSSSVLLGHNPGSTVPDIKQCCSASESCFSGKSHPGLFAEIEEESKRSDKSVRGTRVSHQTSTLAGSKLSSAVGTCRFGGTRSAKGLAGSATMSMPSISPPNEGVCL